MINFVESKLMGMEGMICKCMAVSEEEIIYTVKKKNAHTIAEIQRITGASTGCGRCGVKVQSIIDEQLKDIQSEGN